MTPCSSWAPWGPMPPDTPGFRYIGPWCGACEPVKASSWCVAPRMPTEAEFRSCYIAFGPRVAREMMREAKRLSEGRL